MTKEEMNEILRMLGLDDWHEAQCLYVFYMNDDGVVRNFALNVKRGRDMSDEQVVAMMRREYPESRSGEVLAVERPRGAEYHTAAQPTWMDVAEVCRMLHISVRTLRAWTRKGVFTAHRVGGKLYYERSEIDRAVQGNIRQENGRLDKTWVGANGGEGRQMTANGGTFGG